MKRPGFIKIFFLISGIIFLIAYLDGCIDDEDIFQIDIEEFETYLDGKWKIDTVTLCNNDVTEEFPDNDTLTIEYDSTKGKDNSISFKYQVNDPYSSLGFPNDSGILELSINNITETTVEMTVDDSNMMIINLNFLGTDTLDFFFDVIDCNSLKTQGKYKWKTLRKE